MEPSTSENKLVDSWKLNLVIGFSPPHGLALPEGFVYKNAIKSVIAETPWLVKEGGSRPAEMVVDRKSMHYSAMSIYYNISIQAELKSSQLRALRLYLAGLVKKLAEVDIEHVQDVFGYLEMTSTLITEPSVKVSAGQPG